MEWLFENKDWVFSGVGVAVVAGAITFFKNLRRATPVEVARAQNIHQTTTVTVNQGAPQVASARSPVFTNKVVAMETARILFVDDQTDFPLIKILRKAGWKNVRLVKDIPTFNSPEVVSSSIVFVDIQGVGRALGFKDEGLGLAKAIKTQFGDGKKVVIYSAEPRGDTFHDAWDMVDGRLLKTADPYQYLQMIDDLLGL